MTEPQGEEERAVIVKDHKRAVVLTEKGIETKLHHYINARRSKLRQLSAKSNQIERLMEDGNNMRDIEQREMKTYYKVYD